MMGIWKMSLCLVCLSACIKTHLISSVVQGGETEVLETGFQIYGSGGKAGTFGNLLTGVKMKLQDLKQ